MLRQRLIEVKTAQNIDCRKNILAQIISTVFVFVSANHKQPPPSDDIYSSWVLYIAEVWVVAISILIYITLIPMVIRPNAMIMFFLSQWIMMTMSDNEDHFRVESMQQPPVAGHSTTSSSRCTNKLFKKEQKISFPSSKGPFDGAPIWTPLAAPKENCLVSCNQLCTPKAILIFRCS